jgi:hypothetical protein
VSINPLRGTVTIQQQKYLTGVLTKYLDKNVLWLDTHADVQQVLTQAQSPITQAKMDTMKQIQIVGDPLQAPYFSSQ